MSDGGLPPLPAPAVDRPAGRLVAALLATADRRQLNAFAGERDAGTAVVMLPDLGANVAIFARGDDSPAALKARLDTLLSANVEGLLHIVLEGGPTPSEDRALLLDADRGAHDPNRLGVHLLTLQDGGARVERVAGRRLPLLAAAARELPRHAPPSPQALAAHNGEAKKRREEASAFATALAHRPQRATRLLGAANILLFALEAIWTRGGFSFNRDIDWVTLLAMGANRTLGVEAGEVWRLLSYAFLHGSVVHLLVNLIALFSVGTFLEGIIGWRRMVVLYTLTALAGGLGSVFIGRTHLSVGASGAVWGLIAAGAALTFRRDAILPPLIAGRLRPRLGAVLAVNLLFSLWGYFAPSGVRIDLWAHLGGGLVGALLAGTGLLSRGLIPGSSPQEKAANPSWLHLLACALLALMVGSVGVAFANGEPWRPRVALSPDEIT